MENNRQAADVDVRTYLLLLWQSKWKILLVAMLSGALLFVLSRAQTPIYEASATLLISEGGYTNSASGELMALQTGERLAYSYVERLKNREVLLGALESLSLEMDPDELRDNMDVRPLPDTQLITISVEHANPDIARDLANEIPQVFAERNLQQQLARFASSRGRLEEELAQLEQELLAAETLLAGLTGTAVADQSEIDQANENMMRLRDTHSRILQSYEDIRLAEASRLDNIIIDDYAVTPQLPVRPKVVVNSLLAAVLGGLLAIIVILAIDFFDRTLRSPQQVRDILGLPTIGLLGSDELLSEGIGVRREPRSATTEAFRSLRSNLEFIAVDRPLRTILVTSPEVGDGKTTVSANLAAIIAQGSSRVILLDCDLRRPRLHQILGWPNHRGISDVFRGRARLRDVLQAWDDNLGIIVSGDRPPNPAELLGSDMMEQILASLQEMADVIVIDCSPGIVTDAAVLSTKVDAVLIVARPRATAIDRAADLVEQLRRADANVAGVVLNRISRNQMQRYGGYYAYREYYDVERTDRRQRGLVSGVLEGYRDQLISSDLWRRLQNRLTAIVTWPTLARIGPGDRTGWRSRRPPRPKRTAGPQSTPLRRRDRRS